MANHRMFSNRVITSARFLRMPPTSRLLYYDLGMAADDDGVVEAFSVMRMTAATEDDLRVLAARGFVSVLNDDLVTHITDWKENNIIKKDRYKPSIHAELLVKIQSGTDLEPAWNQSGTDLEPQDKLSKDKIREVIGGAGGDPAPKRKRFTPPTVEMVSEYVQAKGYNVDPDRFVDFYTSNGWKVGRNSMKDWQAAVRTWHKKNQEATQTHSTIKEQGRGSNPENWYD